MNKKVFKIYMKFYIGIICLISIITIIYALINKMDIPIFLMTLDILMAIFLCTIIAFISGRATRIVEEQITINELEDFRKYLLKKQFVEKNLGEYYWNKTPSFLLKSVEVKIGSENSGIVKIYIPFTIIDWRKQSN